MSWCQGQVVLVQDHNRERGLVGDAKPRLPEAGQPLSAPVEPSALSGTWPGKIKMENGKWIFTHRSPTELAAVTMSRSERGRLVSMNADS